jgi:hypothetical protein
VAVVSPSTFDAFATPPGVEAPPAAPAVQAVPTGTSEVTLRHPAASPEWVGALCDTLHGAGPALADRDAAEIAAALGRVGERFLDPADPLRREALELLPPTARLSPAMAAAVLDGMATDWTGDRLAALLAAELGDAAVLDGFVDVSAEPRAEREAASSGRRVMAVGPSLCVQIVAGSVPGVGVSALLRSLVVKGPTLLKPGRGDVVLPVLFARGLAEADRALAAALAVVYWPGGDGALEDAALARADVVTAYGSDATVRDLRARAPVTARFVAYHHRVSVGVVGRGALTAARADVTADAVARSLALFDQRGCVSPQVVYVEEGGGRSPEEFAEALARALAEVEAALPTAPLEPGEASALHQARGTAELLAASAGGRVIHGGAAAWTVLVEPPAGAATPSDPPGATLPPALTAGRVARVRPLEAAESLPGLLAPLAGHLQTVGFAGLGERLEEVARALARVGAARVVPFANVPFPPPWWHHDGGGPLTDLVRWTDLEPE